jgi:leucine dehydrogenase
VKRVVSEFGAEAVAPDAIYGVEADVYAPSALGATINDQTIPQLKVEIVAGAANNVLAEARHGDELHRRGILYAPDYVINGGGLINVYGELKGWTREQSIRKAGEIYDTLLRLFELANDEGIPTYQAADRIAQERIASVGKIQQTWV